MARAQFPYLEYRLGHRVTGGRARGPRLAHPRCEISLGRPPKTVVDSETTYRQPPPTTTLRPVRRFLSIDRTIQYG